MKAKYDITGINCAACSASVERAMILLGASGVSVNLLSGVMQIEYDDSKISEDDIIKAVKKIGFGIEKAKTTKQKRIEKQNLNIKNQKRLLTCFIVSVLFLIPLMYISMGSMYTASLAKEFLSDFPLAFAITQLLLTVIIICINNNYFISGFKHLFAKNPNMDSLIAIGTGAPIVYGIFAIVKIATGDIHFVHDLYFETSGMILTLVTLGKYLEGRSKTTTGNALDKLIDLTPKKATILRDNKEVEILAEELVKGDVVLVKPGQSFVCDGIIISGNGYVDESMLTGESIPVLKQYGDKVHAGTINKNGSMFVQSQEIGEDTVISKIISLVEQASGSKAPISRLADKISRIFVPIVIVISVICAIIWCLADYGFEFAFSRAICILVISCPCALGLATPLAITVGTGVAAQNGILIKNAKILELLGKTNIVLFDKTGTLTTGQPTVTNILIFDDTPYDNFLKLAFSLERNSEHPLASAIVKKANESGISPYGKIENFTEVLGKGIYADIENNRYFSGNLAFLNEYNLQLRGKESEHYDTLCKEGKTPIILFTQNKIIGIIAIADMPKEDSAKAISKLNNMKIKTVMLTGDNEITAKAIASKIGINEVCAGVLPEQKESQVRKFKTQGNVVSMVGDGINDSPALASSDIGFSVSNGTDIALESSDIVLLGNDVLSVPKAILLSKKTISNIKLSLFWALFYNVLGIPLAAGLFYPFFHITLNPMFGAAAMSLSSICVVLNALRLKLFNFK